jgi:hypothetical protein
LGAVAGILNDKNRREAAGNGPGDLFLVSTSMFTQLPDRNRSTTY